MKRIFRIISIVLLILLVGFGLLTLIFWNVHLVDQPIESVSIDRAKKERVFLHQYRPTQDTIILSPDSKLVIDEAWVEKSQAYAFPVLFKRRVFKNCVRICIMARCIGKPISYLRGEDFITTFYSIDLFYGGENYWMNPYYDPIDNQPTVIWNSICEKPPEDRYDILIYKRNKQIVPHTERYKPENFVTKFALVKIN